MLQANSLPGERCPASQQEGLKLEHSSDLSTNVTGEYSLTHPLPPSWKSLHFSPALLLLSKGFNLIRRLNLMKTSAIKKIRNPKGPLILRLGAAPLTQPTR